MTRKASAEQGQVLVLFGAALVSLLAVSALVVDVGLLLSSQQRQRSLADTAALSGVQELQRVPTRAVGAAEREEARGAAMARIVSSLGASGSPTCATGGAPTADADTDGKRGYAADVVGCAITGTDFQVSIVTPSPICADCPRNDRARTLLVEVMRPNVPTLLARVVGLTSWSIRRTSVANLGRFTGEYGLITLRPPRYIAGVDANAADLDIHGSTTELVIVNGDVGVNTNLIYNGNGAKVTLDESRLVDYFDTNQGWTGLPQGRRIGTMIPDPNYAYPTRSGAPTYSTAAQASLAANQCRNEMNQVPDEYTVGGLPIKSLNPAVVTCLKPGIYQFMPAAMEKKVVLLTSGVYFFDQGLFVHGTLIGGYKQNQPGVAIVFRRQLGLLDAANAELFALNAGRRFLDPNGQEANAAIGFDGLRIETGGKQSVKLTIMVERDPNCLVVQPYPTQCGDAGNNTLHLSGGATLYLAGVQYAPSDNIDIAGSTSGTGYAGQVVAWTATYRGDVRVRQEYMGAGGNGVARLDAACTGTGSTGTEAAACHP